MAARDETRDGVTQTFVNNVGKDVSRDPDGTQSRRIILTNVPRFKRIISLSHRSSLNRPATLISWSG
jgi:hypothetical protein